MVLMNLKKGIVIGSVPAGEGKAKVGTGVWIGGSKMTNHGVWGLVFEDGGAIKFEGVGGGIGHGVWVAWIGAVGNLHRVRKSIPVIIGVKIVLDPIPVQIFHLIKQGNNKISFQFRSVLIAYPDPDGIGGGIGLEIKG